MIKLPRFLKEYANYQKASIAGYGLMKEEIKEAAIRKIDGALSAAGSGLITINEAMGLISKPFN